MKSTLDSAAPDRITTQAKAVEALAQHGISITQQALSKRLREGDVPSLPWDPADVEKHAAVFKTSSPLQNAKLHVLVQRGVKLELENQLMLGGYLKKEDVERGQVERVQAVRAEMANIRLLALKLPVTDVRKAEQILEEWAQGVCRKFERGDA